MTPFKFEELLPRDLERMLYQLCHKANEKEKIFLKAEETFSILDNSKKEYFASIVDKQKEKTVASNERKALISDEWTQWLSAYQSAKNNVTEAKIERNAAIRLWETCRSILSSRNQERKMI